MNMRYAMRSEDTEQINVVSWANWNVNRYPELKWLHHVPNGGSRNKQEAVKLKQMGVKAGVSDLCLPYPKGLYCGLYIEMKFGDNRQQETQKEFLADMAGGDARSALNAIELGILTTPRSDDGKIHITLDVASECIQKRVVRYDKNGDNHYDIISAFIKSMRGSDPDAAVYYLAKMLYAGEDVKFIAKRIMILASEDIGNADPQALVVATAAAQAVERVGMPESQIILSQAAAYMACAPKSNAAVNAIFAAMNSVKRTKTTVPVHLQDAHYGGHEKLGHGIGYKYAHDYPNHYVQQQYLPDEIKDEKFYELSDMGYEKKLKEHMEFIRRNKQ